MSAERSMGMVIRFESRQKVEPQPAKPELVLGTEAVLLQGLTLLDGLDNEIYSRIVGAPYKASIGQHYRHVLEHFQCLLRGAALGEVNYDARERNPRIESEADYASEATRICLREFLGYTDSALDRCCRVIHSVSYGSAAATSIESNLARELAYCTGHAIHHYAIIRLICAQLEVEVPEEFGYAPSTLKHLSTLSAD